MLHLAEKSGAFLPSVRLGLRSNFLRRAPGEQARFLEAARTA